jgi:hypothetical protein
MEFLATDVEFDAKQPWPPALPGSKECRDLWCRRTGASVRDNRYVLAPSKGARLAMADRRSRCRSNSAISPIRAGLLNVHLSPVGLASTRLGTEGL